MKRLAIALMAMGPMVGCTATMQDMMDHNPMAGAVGKATKRNWVDVSGSVAPVREATPKAPAPSPAAPEKTAEQQAREKALADQVKYEETVAKTPWRGWSDQRMKEVASENSILALSMGAADGSQPAYIIGINIDIDEVIVGENVYGDRVLKSALYSTPFKGSAYGYATLLCERGLMDTGPGLQPVRKWSVTGEISMDWVAFGMLCILDKASMMP
ncbi:MAG: hypothetical protein K9L32_01420 [Chromatiaceae bacterium]|nr:hypothetical protein [Chromatiaceae bacterium]